MKNFPSLKMTQKTKPYYRCVLEVKPGFVLTSKRGGGSKLRPTDCATFKPGDLCLIENEKAYPLEYQLANAPKILAVLS